MPDTIVTSVIPPLNSQENLLPKRAGMTERTAKKKLAHINRLAKIRRDRYVARKRSAGYTRKSFWLPVDDENFHKLSTWLKNQDADSLKIMIDTLTFKGVSCRELMAAHDEFEKRHFFSRRNHDTPILSK